MSELEKRLRDLHDNYIGLSVEYQKGGDPLKGRIDGCWPLVLMAARIGAEIEREACAVICESGEVKYADACGAAIRARGGK